MESRTAALPILRRQSLCGAIRIVRRGYSLLGVLGAYCVALRRGGSGGALEPEKNPMTIICAYTDGKHTWLGSDTAGTYYYGSSLMARESGPKWVLSSNNAWAYGNVGDGAVSAWIKANAGRLLDFGSEVMPAVVNPPAAFVARLQEVYEALKMRGNYDGDEAVPHWRNQGILATAGKIWEIDSCLAFSEAPADTLCAAGSGKPWALGAGYGWRRVYGDRTSPEALIEVALDAAIRFDMQIRGKWVGKL
jgi:hypothetical protein